MLYEIKKNPILIKATQKRIDDITEQSSVDLPDIAEPTTSLEQLDEADIKADAAPARADGHALEAPGAGSCHRGSFSSRCNVWHDV